MALRFLKEDPWERLADLREAVPNICLQMLLRGRNTVGYTPYPETVTKAFIREASATGVDIYRIFDALNNIEAMRPAIDAVREVGTSVAEVAMCYTGDLSNPGENLYTLDYYLKLAEQIVDAGAHVLAIMTWRACCAARGGDLGDGAALSVRPARARPHMTPRVDNWPRTWRPGRRVPMRWTVPRHPWPGPPASPPCRRLSQRPHTASTTPECP